MYILNEYNFSRCRRYKQNITDNQNKKNMESLMKMNQINKLTLLNENQERNKFICLFNCSTG
jgi:hypothetical protein